MELLAQISVPSATGERTIGLYHGDLARIPAEHAVDLLVVSAFPDDYAPTPSSLIGALHREGVSVGELAACKYEDLRREYGCWLSPELPSTNVGFRRILCFEPAVRGRPPEVVGDIFRCLMPFVQGELPMRSVAMPLVASGDQGVARERIFAPLIEAAVHWLEIGLQLDTIKIVEHDLEKAKELADSMRSFAPSGRARSLVTRTRGFDYDVFLSYSRKDQDAIDFLDAKLRAHESRPRVFKDTLEINRGTSWQQEIWNAMEACRRVVAFYSPEYFKSKVCQEEYAIARLRDREESDILVPVYLRSARLPAYVRILNYRDCREADHDRLKCILPDIL